MKATDYYAYKHPLFVNLLTYSDLCCGIFTSVTTQMWNDTEESGWDYID